MEHLTCKAATVATELGEFEAIISTGSVDRDGDIIDPTAMVRALHAWAPTDKTIPLHWNHKTEPEDIVGHVNPGSAMQTGGEVAVTGKVDLDAPRGPEVWRVIKSGSVGFSYGFLVTESKPNGKGVNITGLDIFEVSVTPAPANRDTRVLSWKSADHEDEDGRLLPAPINPDITRAVDEFVSSLRNHIDGDDEDTAKAITIEHKRAEQDAKAARIAIEEEPIKVKWFTC